MDVYAVVGGESRYFLDAAARAADELGLYAVLPSATTQTPPAEAKSAAELAALLGVRPRRLARLLDVLALDGGVVRSGTRENPCFSLARPAPMSRVAAPQSPHWGQLAEVIRRDRPLDDPAISAAPGEPLERFHRHLESIGAGAARALSEHAALPDHGALLDAGGGSGVYTAAFLDGNPTLRATLVDRPEVLRIARRSLSRFGDRVRFVDGNLEQLGASALPEPHDYALLANLLHLYPPDTCQRLLSRAASSLRPGGRVAVKDLRVEPDRSGPAAGVIFALNMALYTDGGDVHDPIAIGAWMRAAGLAAIAVETLAAAPDAIVVTGSLPTAAPET